MGLLTAFDRATRHMHMGSKSGTRGGTAHRSSDPYEAKRRELLKRGRQELRDDTTAQRELAEFEAEMRRRRDASAQ